MTLDLSDKEAQLLTRCVLSALKGSFQIAFEPQIGASLVIKTCDMVKMLVN